MSVTCSAIGSPELRIVWINGEIETQNNVLMVDSSLEKFDEKNFTCIALNEFGFDSQSVLVQIVGGTSWINENLRIEFAFVVFAFIFR